MAENMDNAEIVLTKQDEQFKKLSEHVRAEYADANVKEKHQELLRYANGKMKVIQVRRFANGVIKRALVGVIKENKIIFDRGIDFKKLNLDKAKFKSVL